MITSILVFFATAIAIVLYTIYSFRKLALLILLFLLIFIALKVRREIKKYGSYSIFRAFHKYPNENQQFKLVKYILKNNLKMEIITEFDSNFLVALHPSGVYIVKVLEVVGKITKANQIESLIVSSEKTAIIPNFFLGFKQIEEKLRQQLDVTIKKVIVKKGTCLFDFPYSKEYLVTGMHNFYYQMVALAKEKTYTKEELKAIESSILHCLSNNVKS